MGYGLVDQLGIIVFDTVRKNRSRVIWRFLEKSSAQI